MFSSSSSSSLLSFSKSLSSSPSLFAPSSLFTPKYQQQQQHSKLFFSTKTEEEKERERREKEEKKKEILFDRSHDYVTNPKEKGVKKEIEDLLQGNKKWVAHTLIEDPHYFSRLASGQNPHFLYIGCSDSRVPANTITGTHPNEMFVHRNVANMVVATDTNLLTVIHYAVETLKVPHIIVCGHYDCGGIRASLQNKDHGFVENWLQNIRDVYRIHQMELDAIEDNELRVRRLVELNVFEQCLNIFKLGVVQKRRMETHIKQEEGYNFATPRVHGLVYDPAEGLLNKMPINFREEIEKYRSVYDLYSKPDSTE